MRGPNTRLAIGIYLALARLVGGTGRHNENRATRDTNQAGRDAAEDRGFECSASTRADDDQLGSLVVGELGESLGWVADHDASVGLLEPCRRAEPSE